MSAKFSIQQQLEELKRELAMRVQVYPRQVSTGKMRQSEADYHTARLVASIDTLKWIEANELTIKQRLA